MATKKTSAKKSSGAKKSTRTTQKKMKKVMHEYKHGELKSGRGGKGGKVKNPKQAIAIGLSEARKAGAKVPPKKGAKKTSSKKTARKSASKKK
ncbi:MAG TPA: DUF6496 domain-containing protein [Bryobacteraceae bacterium]|nr:DUF6496 domain-containing protein [Bryobacteraceae bacterium]